MRHALLICFLLGSTLSFAQSDSLDAKILRLLELAGSEANFNSAVDNMLEMQKGQTVYASLPDAWWVTFSNRIHERGWPELAPKMVEIYRDNYTEEEIDHQLAYLASPITQAMVLKQPTVMKLSMDVGKVWGENLAVEIAQELEQATKTKE